MPFLTVSLTPQRCKDSPSRPGVPSRNIAQPGDLNSPQLPDPQDRSPAANEDFHWNTVRSHWNSGAYPRSRIPEETHTSCPWSSSSRELLCRLSRRSGHDNSPPRGSCRASRCRMYCRGVFRNTCWASQNSQRSAYETVYPYIIISSFLTCSSSLAAVLAGVLNTQTHQAAAFFTFYSLPHFHYKMKRFVFRQFYSENPVKLGFFAIDNLNRVSII